MKIQMRNIYSKRLVILYAMAFLLALSAALPAYIQSSYLETYVGVSLVSWFFIAANITAIVAIFLFPKFIKYTSTYLSSGLGALGFLLSFIGMSLSTNAFGIFLFFILMQVSSYLVWITLDIFLESSSSDASTGRIRTMYFTFINLAWLISPSISAWIVEARGYEGAYLASSFIMVPFLAIYLINRSHLKSKKVKVVGHSLRKSLKEVVKDKNILGIYVAAAQLTVFLNAANVFLPIYLHQHLGFSWGELSIAFSIMLIPFLIVEIPAGIIADRYLGEKEILTLGFLIILACLAVFFVSTSDSIWFWAGLLFVSRIGVALVEAMRESYFFKNVNEHDVEKINIFRTASPVGYILASFVSLLVLVFLPIEYVFAAAALLICLFVFPFLTIMRDSR